MGQYLGQHFLSDKDVLASIVDEILHLRDFLGVTSCFEIGPGKGALTKHIFPLFNSFFLFEKDERMQPHLKKFQSKGTIFWGDVLEGDIIEKTHSHDKTNLQEKIISQEITTLQEKTISDMGHQDLNNNLEAGISTPSSGSGCSTYLEIGGVDISICKNDVIVVGNLPYYITSPIFRKFFTGETLFPGGVFLIQKEVAEKIKTNAKKKSYLWWLLNYSYAITYCFTVDKKAFTPPPNVQSAVVMFIRGTTDHKFTLHRLIGFLDIVSKYSRKTLGRIQKLESVLLEDSNIHIPECLFGMRLEQCSWEDVSKILEKRL